VVSGSGTISRRRQKYINLFADSMLTNEFFQRLWAERILRK
jgi:hypothetical protein